MAECIHCDIHDLLDPHLRSETANLAEITAKVTEVLADLILLAPPADQMALVADTLAYLGEFLLRKSEDEPQTDAPSTRRH